MSNKYNTKSIVEAGLLTAIILILVLLNIYVPIFFTVGRFILPIPVVILYIRHDLKTTIISLFISGIITGAVYNPVYGLTTIVMFGLTGIALGYSIKNKKSFLFTIAVLSLAFILGTILDFTVYIKIITNTSLAEFVNQSINEIEVAFNEVITIYKNLGISEQQLKPILDSLEVFKSGLFLKMIPAITIISAVIFSYLTFIISKPILKKLGYNNIVEVTPISKIQISIKIATVVAIFLLIGVILARQNIKYSEYILVSTQLILQYIFLIEGISVAIFYLKNRFNMSKGLIIVIMIFTIFSSLGIIYFAIGFMDLIMDFRKLDPNRKMRIK
ncbi:YybS family protein [Clostridium cochlearium]|jgi:uncharacterized protein YybS (DUF2232 family)|uniref:Membrane protein n=1 Tax=Clostridium cochlearium TaxID=1494 RepID=A0A1G9GTR4_CLOCO|nr:YybS family protein [Clostridium cochlearium]MBV1819576.1 YybS family protein [Bacteroidales bacterium MSK.15.36]NSJ90565.1 YybS family protein [Coprococcus sp. MSK.21.13]MCG4571944.1 YybS family protein [Clostridium cochlearium]MCG4579732.1 YybS family protein [Clostridium cochlearium]MCR1972099.1 YybS family protein [Clostridium cochlearium]